MNALFNELSFGEVFALGVAFVAIFWLTGMLINALLQDRSLGVIGNALLMFMGGAFGFWVKILITGPIS